jgi:hypothetical protein
MKPKISLVGTWVSIEDASSVEFCIAKKKSGYGVTVIDSFDDEVPAISEEKYDGKTGIFSFALYWDSTGRFSRYRMKQSSEDKVEITYTHTDSEVLIRK